MHRLLLDTCKEVGDADTKRLSAARFEKVSSKYTKILDIGKTELPPRPPCKGKRDRIPKSEGEKVHEAFVNYKNEILCFAKRSDVPFSNNLDYADNYAMPTMRSKGLISLERTVQFVGIVTSLQGMPAVHLQADKPPSAHHADGFDPSPLS